LITRIKLIQETDEVNAQSASAADSEGQAAWLVELKKKIERYSDIIPNELKTL